jgi:hypothetical protein
MKSIIIITISFISLSFLMSSCTTEAESREGEYLDFDTDWNYEQELEPIGIFDEKITIQVASQSGDSLYLEMVLDLNTTEVQKPSFALINTKIKRPDDDGLYWTKGACSSCEHLEVRLESIAVKDSELKGTFSGLVPSAYTYDPEFYVEGEFNVLLDD